MMQWLAEEDLESSFPRYRERCERELLGYLTGKSEAVAGAVQSEAS
jgi:hypothetical protein